MQDTVPVNQLSLEPSTIIHLSIPSTRHPYVPANNANVVRSFTLLRSDVASIASLRCGEVKLSGPCLVTKVYLRNVNTRTASESADVYHIGEKRTNITIVLLNAVSSAMTPKSSLDRMVGPLDVFDSFLAFAIAYTGSGARCDKESLHPPLQICFVALASSQIRLALLKCSSMMEVVSIFLFRLKAILVAGEIWSRSWYQQ